MNTEGPVNKVTSDWDAYWQNTRLSAETRREGGPKDAALDRFWLDLFSETPGLFSAPANILDIACGHGPVIRHLQSVSPQTGEVTDSLITGLDSSLAALVETRSRFPGTTGVAASATHLPFANDMFNLVTSQFGIEYAGADAIPEACRVLRPRGTLAVILHYHDGRIYRESQVNLDAVNGFLSSGLLNGLADIFEAALAINRSQADSGHFQNTDKKFAATVKASEAVLRQWGKTAADGLLFKVYNDVGHIYRNFKNYDPQQVFEWIELVTGELESYAGRMASMLASALDEQSLDALIEALAQKNVKALSRGVIQLGTPPVNSAWTLVTEKQVA